MMALECHRCCLPISLLAVSANKQSRTAEFSPYRCILVAPASETLKRTHLGRSALVQ